MDISQSAPMQLDLYQGMLILGVLLWSGAHVFGRIAPARRAAMGPAGRGPVALAIVAGIVLMGWGYLGANGPVFWGRTPALTGINNLLMLLSLYLFAVSGLKTRLAQYIRHPQLTAVKLWAVAHLLVNGALEDLILFGGLLAWGVVEVIILNRQTTWTKPDPAPAKKEIRAVLGTLLIYGGFVAIHYGRGYYVFG